MKNTKNFTPLVIKKTHPKKASLILELISRPTNKINVIM